MPGINMAHTMRTLLAQLSCQHVECFGAGMRVHRRLAPRRSPRVVNAQQILGGGNQRHRPDLGYDAAAQRWLAFRTEREEPNLSRHFGGKPGRACRRLCLSESGEILYPPKQRSGGKLLDFLLGDILDFKFLCRRDRR